MGTAVRGEEAAKAWPESAMRWEDSVGTSFPLGGQTSDTWTGRRGRDKKCHFDSNVSNVLSIAYKGGLKCELSAIWHTPCSSSGWRVTLDVYSELEVSSIIVPPSVASVWLCTGQYMQQLRNLHLRQKHPEHRSCRRTRWHRRLGRNDHGPDYRFFFHVVDLERELGG